MEQERQEKSGPLTQVDLEILGYRKITRLPAEGRFRLYIAQTRAGIGHSTHAFVYPLVSAEEQDIQEIERLVTDGVLKRSHDPDKIYVVVPKGLQSKPKLESIYIYEDLMWTKIEADFSEYMERSRQGMEDLMRGIYYVEPSFSDGSVPTEYLHSFLSGKAKNNGIVVVQGEAMFGKTTLAASVARGLSQYWKQFRVIPILLGGQTAWRQLAERSRFHKIANLWDILSLILRQGASVNEGLLLRKEDLFKRIMQQGYIALIFDGFDELPKVGEGRISPQDNFEWLSEVAVNSSARILVTTRPAFWEREVVDTAEHPRLSLASFDKDMAYQYFDRYFESMQEGGEKAAKAKNMYQDLLGGASSETEKSNFFKLPDCVRMIADYVKNGGTVPLIRGKDQQSMVRGFLMQILERERQRQKISIRANALYQAFEEMAVCFNGEFDLSDLECGLPPGIDKDGIGKIQDHAFIDSSAEKFRFRQDFLLHYLKASYVHRLLTEPSGRRDISEEWGKNKDLRALISAEEEESGGQLAERVADLLDIGDLDKLGKVHSRLRDSKHPLKSFLFHVIAKTVIDPTRMPRLTRSERAERVLSLLGGDANSRRVSNLFVQGEIRQISLGGWTITKSHFCDFRLVECGNDGPHFVKCTFEGELDLGHVKCDIEKDCEAVSQDAKLVMNKIAGWRMTDDEITDCMRNALKCFWASGSSSIAKGDWKRGDTRAIEERFELLEIMHRCNFIEEEEREGLEGEHGRLKVKDESIEDLRDFLEYGILRNGTQRIFDTMKEKAGSLKS